MNIVNRIRRRAVRMISSNVPVKSFRLQSKQPIVSFTFDDCPQSAVRLGADILEKHQVTGTFYVCGGLTDRFESEMLCHSESDLLNLIRNGHEVGSHLFHHKNCEDLSLAELEQEIALNDGFFKKLQSDRPLLNFAYPFGGTTLAARKIAAKKYTTARGIRPGINSGLVDFSNLYGNSIYSRNTTKEDISRIIDQAVYKAGWGIFYTHDIQETPSEWGTTPELLDFAITKAIENGCQVLTIRNAIGAVGFRQ